MNPQDTWKAIQGLINSGDILGTVSSAVKQSYLDRIDHMMTEYERAGAGGAFNAGVEAGKLVADLASLVAGGWGAAKGGGILIEKVAAKVAAPNKITTPERVVAPKGVVIAPGKFDYLFGRVSSNAHNAARSNQLAFEMQRLGVPDTAAGRQMLTQHLELAAKTEGNITRTFSNQYGRFEVRESLFIGPSGKVAKFESTFQVLEDGTRQLSTVIPFH
ncbi:hypothetical protein [Zobellella sp. DQSA1]|uniref:hypothetical protein n=1 Tax=Zobellella sp. DQSA1 TaxID=3342386 RepID=UPI0035C13122